MSSLRCLGSLALCGSVACGDNLLGDGVALVPGAELVIVAHQDDDLLFMQPDVLEAVQRGAGVTSVYVTAGNGNKGSDKAEERYEGLRHAYAAAAGASDWQCGYIDLVSHVAQHCRLASAPVSLVFLGYPDGGKLGESDTSLLRLWEGAIDSVETIGDRTTRYNRDSLIEAVAQILRETQPSVVRTLEIASTHGRDHSDHMLVGALAVLAIARANNHAELVSYRGYSIAEEPPNKHPAVYDASYDVLAYYEACSTDCGTCGQPCTTFVESHAEWLRRRYAIGFRRFAAGRLRANNRCLGADLALASCDGAPSWRLDTYGQLRSADNRCLIVAADGEVALAECLGGRERRFFLDDEGHIWSGVPPMPTADMDYAHLYCLAPTATGVQARVCGADREATWELMPRTVVTSRALLGFAATGREVRMGDLTGDGKADLCAIENGLRCAPGDGAGGFAAAARLDTLLPVTFEPRSLTLGDVDGDQWLDACGRDRDGIVCATAASGFTPMRWSPSFNDDVASTSTSASLSALDADADGIADICGVDTTGVVCAPRGMTLKPIVRSAWPEPTAIVWPADLDGDRSADWCAATDEGPACAVEAQRELTTDGAPWGYAYGGMVDVAPATTVTVALADIDGDRRADLCAPREDRILCARSQGRAFGPRVTTLAILPNQSVVSALWLGDLDGDGRADACADTGTSVVCAVEP